MSVPEKTELSLGIDRIAQEISFYGNITQLLGGVPDAEHIEDQIEVNLKMACELLSDPQTLNLRQLQLDPQTDTIDLDRLPFVTQSESQQLVLEEFISMWETLKRDQIEIADAREWAIEWQLAPVDAEFVHPSFFLRAYYHRHIDSGFDNITAYMYTSAVIQGKDIVERERARVRDESNDELIADIVPVIPRLRRTIRHIGRILE